MLTHKGTVGIRTERLVLRKIRHEDAEAVFYGWTSDERVARYTSWYTHADIGTTRAYIDYLLSLDDKTSYNWIIELENRAVGMINVCYIDEDTQICGIAYALAYDYWGRGIITEAFRAVAAFLFEHVNCRKIIAGCDNQNMASRKVMEKTGMKQEAYLRAQIKRKDGSYGDDVQYGLFKEELIL